MTGVFVVEQTPSWTLLGWAMGLEPQLQLPILSEWATAALGGAALLTGIAASLLLITSILLLGECLAAWRPTRVPLSILQTDKDQFGNRLSVAAPRTAILVPAHNEAAVITQTLADIQDQLRQDSSLAQAELWVIADNCDDATAELSRQAGANVVERQSHTDRGKGYALDYGLQQIAAASAELPEIVVMVDADCRVHAGAIAALVKTVMRHQRPVQGNYHMTLSTEAKAEAGIKDRITVFATKVKNEVRSLGLSQLGLPCLLVGTGMAFPWSALQSISLASGELVEDMKLGFDLAIAQQSPIFCREAVITADLPQTQAAARSQRTRWEHGRLDLTRRYWPKLMREGLRQGRFGLVALALDMAILPLSLLVTLWFMLSCIALALGCLGSWTPLAICMAAGLCIVGAILLAWLQVGRQVLPFNQLLLVPMFILWKLPIFLSFVFNPQRSWVRTERDPV